MSTPTISRRARHRTTPKVDTPAAPDSPQAIVQAMPSVDPPAGQTTDDGQREQDNHPAFAVVGTDHRLDHAQNDAHARSVEPVTTSDGHEVADTQDRYAVGAPISITGRDGGADFPADQAWRDAQRITVGGDQNGNGSAAATAATTPRDVPPLADPFLALAADILDDAQDTRIANENRLRQLTRSEEDSDGEERGFGLDAAHPDVAQVATLVQMFKCDSTVVLSLGFEKPKKERGKPCCIEHNAETNLTRSLRKHPLGPWVKAQKGIGEKQAARLLAVIGDPYVNMQTGEIRTVSQLWAYCGHGDPNRKRAKGMSQAELFALGNPTAKSRVWLIACNVLKAQGPLSEHYYDRKAKTEGREHATECKRCGPSGKPAQPGSPWSDAHRHADALRITGKEILRGLWLEAKRIHELPSDGHESNDTHIGRAVTGGTTLERTAS